MHKAARLIVVRPLLLASLLGTQLYARAQSSMPNWQAAAGNIRQFEVASIRPASPDSTVRANLDLDSSDYYRVTGGLLTATGSLINYIIFAYKIADASQYPALYAQLPKWAHEQFVLQARATSSPSKDEVRLMVQSLLTERFQLAMHEESRQMPIYSLVQDRPGTLGPTLRPRTDDTLCTKALEASTPAVHSSTPPPICELILFTEGELIHARMMGYTMQQIAGNLVSASKGALASRPIIDGTNLTGRFDVDITYAPPPDHTSMPTTMDTQTEGGETFIDSLKKQAGLKLLKQTGPAHVYVIDHIEPASAN